MQNIYKSVEFLDKACYDLGFSEDILMENAALGLCRQIEKKLTKNKSVIFLCGSGNNAADGIAAARMLNGKFDVSILLVKPPKSKMAKIQLKRARAIKVCEIKKLKKADCFVDCLVGSGLKGEIDEIYANLLKEVNAQNGLKIACDIPSGIDINGNAKIAFKADFTITMGALKLSLFSEIAKEYAGKIKVANLGIQRENYEKPSNFKLLENQDLILPNRKAKSTHKGNFGHLCVLCGEKQGAAKLCALSAISFGAGLVSVLGDVSNLEPFLISSKTLPQNTTAIAAGMGLGDKFETKFLEQILLENDIPLVIDADLLTSLLVKKLVNLQKDVVLTPHIKEFAAMLDICGFGKFSTDEILQDKINLAQKFAKNTNALLVLKSANTIIAYKDEIFISNGAKANLSKGGSGDVLAGLIASLLAQKYDAKTAAITAVLAQAKASQNCQFNDFATLPTDIIKEIKCL